MTRSTAGDRGIDLEVYLADGARHLVTITTRSVLMLAGAGFVRVGDEAVIARNALAGFT